MCQISNKSCSLKSRNAKESDKTKQNKTKPISCLQPYEVAGKQGNAAMIQWPDGVKCHRNVSHVKYGSPEGSLTVLIFGFDFCF